MNHQSLRFFAFYGNNYLNADYLGIFLVFFLVFSSSLFLLSFVFVGIVLSWWCVLSCWRIASRLWCAFLYVTSLALLTAWCVLANFNPAHLTLTPNNMYFCFHLFLIHIHIHNPNWFFKIHISQDPYWYWSWKLLKKLRPPLLKPSALAIILPCSLSYAYNCTYGYAYNVVMVTPAVVGLLMLIQSSALRSDMSHEQVLAHLMIMIGFTGPSVPEFAFWKQAGTTSSTTRGLVGTDGRDLFSENWRSCH